MTLLLVVAGAVWLAAVAWLVRPPARVRLPDRVSDTWLMQYDQQDR